MLLKNRDNAKVKVELNGEKLEINFEYPSPECLLKIGLTDDELILNELFVGTTPALKYSDGKEELEVDNYNKIIGMKCPEAFIINKECKEWLLKVVGEIFEARKKSK